MAKLDENTTILIDVGLCAPAMLWQQVWGHLPCATLPLNLAKRIELVFRWVCHGKPTVDAFCVRRLESSWAKRLGSCLPSWGSTCVSGSGRYNLPRMERYLPLSPGWRHLFRCSEKPVEQREETSGSQTDRQRWPNFQKAAGCPANPTVSSAKWKARRI